ncbi:MAG: oligosaccharide flippase family protein [Candidatus Omnitrophica bacterium]|nr:oligosaccharide flippase family protein [Candidatus Omnitrophota bacterium]
MKQLIFKNTFFCGLSTFVIGLTGLFLLPFMIIKLGAEQYGLIAIVYIFTMNGYINLFELGFQGGVARYVAKYKEEQNVQGLFSVTISSFAIFLALGVVLLAVSFLFKGFLVDLFKIPALYASSVSTVLGWVFLSYLFVFPSVVFMGYFQGLQRYDVLKITEIVTYLSYALGTFFYLNSGGSNFQMILYFFLISLFFRFVTYGVFFVFDFSQSGARVLFDKEEVAKVWGMAKYLFAGKPASMLYHNAPRLMVAIFLGPVAMTGYEIVMKIPRFLKSGLGFLNSAVMPVASTLEARGDQVRLKKLFLCGFKYQFLFLLPALSVCFLFSREILHFWMPAEYEHLFPLLRIMFVWNLLAPLVAYSNSIMTGMERKLKLMAFWVWGVVLISTLFIVLTIHWWGLYSAVIGYLLGTVLWIPFIAIWTCRETGSSSTEFFLILGNGLKYVFIPLTLYVIFRHFLSNIVLVALFAVLCMASYFVVLFYKYLTQEERGFIVSLLPMSAENYFRGRK